MKPAHLLHKTLGLALPAAAEQAGASAYAGEAAAAGGAQALGGYRQTSL